MVDLIRCMGGNRCSHTPGTCTASNVEYQAKAKAQIEAYAPPATQADDALVEELARALCRSDWTRQEFADEQFCDELLRAIYDKYARAILPILRRKRTAAHAAGEAKGRADERAENYKTFTDGMEAAAQICGSLAETTYDDADAFEAATGCEAAIMRVVKDQRKEQSDTIGRGQHKEPGK